MRKLLHETLQFIQELRMTNPMEAREYDEQENEIRRQLTTLETDFVNDLERIQRSMREIF